MCTVCSVCILLHTHQAVRIDQLPQTVERLDEALHDRGLKKTLGS